MALLRLLWWTRLLNLDHLNLELLNLEHLHYEETSRILMHKRTLKTQQLFEKDVAENTA